MIQLVTKSKKRLLITIIILFLISLAIFTKFSIILATSTQPKIYLSPESTTISGTQEITITVVGEITSPVVAAHVEIPFDKTKLQLNQEVAPGNLLQPIMVTTKNNANAQGRIIIAYGINPASQTPLSGTFNIAVLKFVSVTSQPNQQEIVKPDPEKTSMVDNQTNLVNSLVSDGTTITINGGATPTPTPVVKTVCTQAGSGCNYVGPDGIQQAIDNSSSGEIILIKNGTYNISRLDIGYNGHPAKQGITIKGESKDTILDGSSGSLWVDMVNIGTGSKLTFQALTFRSALANCINIFETGVGDLQEVTVKNSIFYSCGRYGLQFSTGNFLTLTNNVFNGNLGGISVGNFFAVKTISNNIFSNQYDPAGNFGMAMHLGSGSNNVITSYNLFYNNQNGCVSPWNSMYFYLCTQNGSIPAEGQPEQNPKFNGTNDFHLDATSPAKNAGNPALSDPDTTPSDMGAYGGPGACDLDKMLFGCN